MSAALVAIITAGGGGALTLLIVWAVNALRTRSSLPRRMEKVEGVLGHVASEMSVQTVALKATLEALRDGKCNGNVKAALEDIEKQQRDTAAFYQAKALER